MTPSRFSSIAATSLLLATGWAAQAQSTNSLSIHHAVEVEYQTELGKTYTLQGTVDLDHWTDIGSPILGNGQSIQKLISTRDSSVLYTSYRLNITPGPTNGYAPWNLSGVQVQMEDHSSSNRVHYLSSTNGHDLYLSGNDDFEYRYLRTGANESEVERSYSPTRRDRITYTYSGEGSGSWVREEYEQNVMKNREVGSFHYYGTTNATGNPIGNLQAPNPPNTLTGLVYYVFTGPSPDKYEFRSAGNSGAAYPGNSSGEVETTSSGNVFTYNYTVLSSNTASLVINFGYYGIGGDRQEYDLEFNDGSSARFTRRIYRLGSLFTTDHGVFTQNSYLNSSTGSGTTDPNPTTPPTQPQGYTYTLNVDEHPIRLVFQSPVGGLEFDDSSTDEFTYTYTAVNATTYHLVVRFKADKWDDYVLTFTTGRNGSAVRKVYRKGALDKTVGGGFTVAPNAQ